jgi:hypothetical protein
MIRPTLYALLATLSLPHGLAADRIEKQVPVTAGQRLVLELETGAAVAVHGAAVSAAVVVIDREGRDAADVEVTVEPTPSGGARIRTHFTGRGRSYSSSLRLDVRVPRRFGVELDSTGGSVHLDGLEGRFHGRTMGGELELTQLTGEVDLRTLGGDIRVASSKLNGKVSTHGGNVRFDDVEGDVEGSSLGGTVTYRNVRGGRQPAGATERSGRRGSGGTTPAAAAAESAHGAVVMSSLGGDLDVEHAPDGADLKTLGGNVRVRSAGRYVKAQTLGGDIVIDQVDGRVDATTMGGNITVNMVGGAAGDRRVHLDSKSGELRLAVPSDLAMAVDIHLYYTRDSRRSYRVHSDFPLKIEESGEWDTTHGSPRKLIRATGRQGAGTHRIELVTINGDIYLTRAK